MPTAGEGGSDRGDLPDRVKNNPDAIEIDTIATLTEGTVDDRKIAAETLDELAVRSPAELTGAANELKSLLGDPESSVRNKATVVAYRLARRDPEAIEPVLPILINRLEDEGAIRHTALSALATAAPALDDKLSSAVPLLGPCLQSDIGDVRDKALTILVHTANDEPENAAEFLPHLLDILDNQETSDVPDSDMLREITGEDVRKELRQNQNQARVRDEEIRSKAVFVIREIADSKPSILLDEISELQSLLTTEDESVKVGVGDTLALIAAKHPDAVEPLIPEIEDLLREGGSSHIKGVAARALGNIAESSPRAVVNAVHPDIQSLLELLKQEEDHVQASAAGLISYLGEEDSGMKDAVPLLIEQLGADNPTVRGAAAVALGSLEADRASPELRKLKSDDPNEDVREAAADAIARIKSNEGS